MFQINVSGPEMNPGEIPNPHVTLYTCTQTFSTVTLYTCTQTFNTITLYTCLLLSTGQYS